MRKFGLVAAAFIATCLAAPAFAQDDDDMIVVTGSMITGETEDAALPVEVYGAPTAPSGPPYVSITIPADYVIFTVNLESGTRVIEERKRELAQTFTALATRVSRSQGVTMEVGRPGRSAAAETTAAGESIVNLRDRSFIPLVFKIATRSGDTFAAVRGRAETFIAGIQASGRVETVTGDLQYIGVTEPKKHREELLRRIADDTRLLQSIFGAPGAAPEISLTGLQGRVRTRPSGPLEMEMFIPYAIVLGSPPPR